jgi:hypothetical protein
MHQDEPEALRLGARESVRKVLRDEPLGKLARLSLPRQYLDDPARG